MTATTSFFLTLGTTLLATLAFMLCGLWFILRFPLERPRKKAFQLASAFFIGSSLFLICFRSLSPLVGSLRGAIGISFGIMLLFAVLGILQAKKNLEFSPRDWKFAGWGLLVAVLFEVLILTYWLTPAWTPRDAPMECVGTLHSGRYVGLAEYIVAHDRIPILGQNYGQSLLTCISLLAGAKSPYLALNLWLSTHVCMLTLLVFGFFRMIGGSFACALSAVCVTALGGSAFSLGKITVIDSGNPWLLNGYSDSIAGLATVLVFLILYESVGKTDPKSFAWVSVVWGIFTLRWGMSAPQNIVLMLVLLSAAFLGRVLFKVGWRLRHILVFGLVLGTLTAALRQQGGMMTPLKLQESVKIPGIFNVEQNQPSESKVAIVPYLRQVFFSSCDDFKNAESPPVESVRKLHLLLDQKWKDIDVWPSILGMCEDYAFSALRALFWPLAGTVAAFLIGFNARRRLGSARASQELGSEESAVSGETLFLRYLFPLSVTNLFLFGAGAGACFLFEFNGFKWELSRFMIPGYGLGMILLVGSAGHVIDSFTSGARAINCMSAVVGLTCFGPATFLAYNCLRNISSGSAGFSFSKRLERLVTRTGVGVGRTEYTSNIQGILRNLLQIAGQRISFGGSFTPFALVLRATALQVEEANVTLDADKQEEALCKKLESLALQSPYDGVGIINIFRESGSAPEDGTFVVTIEHKDADPSVFKIPFRIKNKLVEFGTVSTSSGTQRLLPWR